MHHLPLALRQLLKAPGFALTAIVTLALGIGVCTTMFSVIQTVMLRSLPVANQDELVVIWQKNSKRGIDRFGQSLPNFFDYREQTTTLRGVVALNGFNANVTVGDQAIRLPGAEATHGFTAALGVSPLLGRAFLPGEDQPGARRVVMISSRFWRDHYASNPEVLGTTLAVNGEPHEIVGVLGSDVALFQRSDIWRPLAMDRGEDRDNHFLVVIGRLKSGITRNEAQSELATIAAGFVRADPEYLGWEANAESLYDVLVPPSLRQSLLVLFGAVGCVLLIACANVANLLLVRALARQRELAVRRALGANWRHVFAQVFSETALLATGGGLAGILVALWGAAFLRTSLPADMLRADQISVDGASLAFVVATSLIVTVLAGFFPARRALRAHPAEILSSGTRTVGASPHRQRTRSVLVVVQFALSTVLLVGAGLLLRSFDRLQQVDPGFTTSGVLSFKISPDRTRYGNEQPRLGFFQQISERLGALPGVTSVGLTSGLPLDSVGATSLNVFPDGPSALAPGESIQTSWRIISADYFAAMQIPVVQGRAFDAFDTTSAAPAIIISARLANLYWPGQDAVGKRVDPGGGGNLRTIVGVVADTNLRDLTGDSRPAMYLPLTQWWGWDTMSVVLRTGVQPETLAPAVRGVMREIDPAQPLFDVQPLTTIIDARLQPARLNSSLLTIFAGLALLLAAVGIYAVVAASVAERCKEIGVRMALGAQIADILRLVLRQGFVLASVGVGAGLITAFVAARVLAAQLYATPATDPFTYLVTAALLGGASLIACWIPARRAAKLDPLVALRAE